MEYLAVKPVSTPGYVLGVAAGTFMFFAFVAGEALARGDPDAGVFLVASVFMLPLVCGSNCLVGLSPFILLRNIAPAEGLTRFAFIMFILAPIVSSFCIVGMVWIDGLSDYSPYFHSPKPPFLIRLSEAVTARWLSTLLIMLLGGVVCWAVDRAS